MFTFVTKHTQANSSCYAYFFMLTSLSQAGEWSNDKRHGKGVAVFADNTTFQGQWQDDGWIQSAAEPSLCRVKGKGLARAVAGVRANFSIEVQLNCMV